MAEEHVLGESVIEETTSDPNHGLAFSGNVPSDAGSG